MPLRVYAQEAWQEVRAGLRTSMVPLMFVGLMGYVVVALLNAEYLRDMGGANVPRNSALVIYQTTAGQAFWLIFVWAWVFARIVTRDQDARLHEVVLAMPVSIRGLFVARFVGALVLACILGSSSTLALMLIPTLARIGVFPPGSVGPTQHAALLHSWLLFVLPTALGLGATYVVAALRTRNNVGPFGAAAFAILLWMASMVVLRSADAYADVATLMDVSGFGEAEHQTKLWTPTQKEGALMELTPVLLWNRLLWAGIPLSLMAIGLVRLRRETLVSERSKERPAPERPPTAARKEMSLPPVAAAPDWLVATWLDARWQTLRLVSGWPFLASLLLWIVLNTLAPFVHLMSHADGPLQAHGQLLAPFLLDLSFIFSVFGIAGFVGTLVRRDQQVGISELIDATPAPLGVRVLASGFGTLVITLAFALIPTLSAWLVMALSLPAGFDFATPPLYNVLVATPALLELAAATFLVHSAIRSPGTAHALSMFVAFVAVVNHEIGIVSYPPGEVGIPAHIVLSEFSGFAPWLAPLAVLDLFKLSLALTAVALSWSIYVRGTALTSRARLRHFIARLRGAAGVLATGASLAVLGSGLLLHDQLVTKGNYKSAQERKLEDADWEKDLWARAIPFRVAGSNAEITISPETAEAHVVLELLGAHAGNGHLQGGLPDGVRDIRASVNGKNVAVHHAHGAFALDVGACPKSGCDVRLELEIGPGGWRLDAVSPWLHASGVWARAVDVLPRLGLDAERALRSPVDRSVHNLPDHPSLHPKTALATALGVLPAGKHNWSVRVTEHGVHTSQTGSSDGPLDFAFTWLPETPQTLRDDHNVVVWHGPRHESAARELLLDVDEMFACVRRHIATDVTVDTILQVPKALGPLAAHGSLLWVPEDEGWDVAASGAGRTKRRAAIAQALAAASLATRADLRVERGSRFLTSGLAGFVGLACVRDVDGVEAWLRLLTRNSDLVAEKLGALDAPLVSLADDGPAEWVEAYAPLAVLSWSQSVPPEVARASVDLIVEQVRAGASIEDALTSSLGARTTAQLLSVPTASDIRVATDGPQFGAVQAERSRWADGGWKPVAGSQTIVQRRTNDGATQLSSLPLTLSDASPLTLFDAEPCFELSPSDNVWPGTAHPR